MHTCSRWVAAGLLIWMSPALARSAGETAHIVASSGTIPVPAEKLAHRGRSFIPLHSTVIAESGRTRLNFSGTLSIHNTSASDVLVVEAIDYYSDAGERVQRVISEPVALRPLASLQVVVPQRDLRGGTGASFLVDWQTANGYEPAIEAVMITSLGTAGFSFVSQARSVPRP